MPHLASGTIAASEVFLATADARHALGDLKHTTDGRKFRYVKAGASDLVVGNVLQSPAADTDHDDITVRATAVGSTELLITTGAGSGALDLDEYAGGFAVIDTTPGLGYIYKISHHAAIAASTNGTINLLKEDAIQVALTTSSKVTLIKHPYKGVIQSPANTLTGAIVGGAVFPITAAYYGWIQSGGPGAALIGGTPAVGSALVSPGDTAGELVVDPANAAVAVCAYNLIVGRDGKVLPVLWVLD